MEDERDKTTVPPESESSTIEISTRHLIIGFTALLVGSFLVGSGIVLVRDYSKYRRQRAMLKTTERIILTIQPALVKGGVPNE